MSCRTNFSKPKIVKMSDTNFYCCDEMKSRIEEVVARTYQALMITPKWKFCPYCGKRFTLNSGF